VGIVPQGLCTGNIILGVAVKGVDVTADVIVDGEIILEIAVIILFVRQVVI
jgi:stringent starvation protein B